MAGAALYALMEGGQLVMVEIGAGHPESIYWRAIADLGCDIKAFCVDSGYIYGVHRSDGSVSIRPLQNALGNTAGTFAWQAHAGGRVRNIAVHKGFLFGILSSKGGGSAVHVWCTDSSGRHS